MADSFVPPRAPSPLPADPAVLRRYRGARVLLTGATGFIGHWMWRLLEASGADLYVVGRCRDALEEAARDAPGAQHLVADLSRPGAYHEVHQRVQPSIVFNLAAYGVDPSERNRVLAWRLNADLAAEVARSAAEDGGDRRWTGQRMVHVGSGFEYGTVNGSVRESSQSAPASVYGMSKLQGTRSVAGVRARRGARLTVARLFTVYGRGEHAGRLLPSLLHTAATGEPMDATGGAQLRDFTWVGDVAEGLLRLGAAPQAPPVVNLATGVCTTVRRFAEIVMRQAAIPPDEVRFGAVPYRPDEERQGGVDVGLLRATLGWVPPTTVEEGIARTLEAAGIRAEAHA